jgi:hypothetical protein
MNQIRERAVLFGIGLAMLGGGWLLYRAHNEASIPLLFIGLLLTMFMAGGWECDDR